MKSSSSQEVLNPMLYRGLKFKLGDVRISNAGQPARFYRAGSGSSGSVRFRLHPGSETYAVSCPFCRDSKSRLNINHTFGTRAPDGRVIDWAAHCFNENCLENKENRRLLFEFVCGFQNRNDRRSFHIRAVTAAPQIIMPVAPPGPIVPINEASADTPAVEYLNSRDFDVVELAQKYQVGVVGASAQHGGRIYIPIFAEGILAGWQTRYPAELDWKHCHTSKYLNPAGMSKSSLLYNWHIAKHWPFVVVVEGVTSVWRIGEPAVALFGKTLSDTQRRLLLHETPASKPFVVFLDPGAEAEARTIASTLTRAGRNVAIVTSPDHRDPAEFARHEVRALIDSTAAQRHIDTTGWHLSKSET